MKTIALINLVLVMGCGITPFQTPHVSRRNAIIGTFYDPLDSSFHFVGKAEIGIVDTSDIGGVSIGVCVTDYRTEGNTIPFIYEEVKAAFMTDKLDFGVGTNFQIWLPPLFVGWFGGIGVKTPLAYLYFMYNRFVSSYDFWGETFTWSHRLTLGIQKEVFGTLVFIEGFWCKYWGHNSGEGFGGSIGLGIDKYY